MPLQLSKLPQPISTVSKQVDFSTLRQPWLETVLQQSRRKAESLKIYFQWHDLSQHCSAQHLFRPLILYLTLHNKVTKHVKTNKGNIPTSVPRLRVILPVYLSSIIHIAWQNLSILITHMNLTTWFPQRLPAGNTTQGKKLERMCPCFSKLVTQNHQLCIAAATTVTIPGRTEFSHNLHFPATLNKILRGGIS